ncbi:MAG TPA: hypothetical protein VFW87_11135 [Pirellulales bacterium]|nr:hypothetical protein [Pirellulales bacterium]
MLVTALALLAAEGSLADERYFAIQVVDDQTGRGVPLAELETVNHVRLVTDSAGRVAFAEPGLMDQTVFFYVRSHGYEIPKDGFGYAGVRLKTTAGESATIKIQRRNIAERLYRATGEGIYRDSVLLDKRTPIAQPLLNAQVAGLDSVQAAVHRGQIYWFFGDTQRPAYPLGHFGTAGAKSRLPGSGGLSPDRGIDFDYFRGDDGFSRPTCDWKTKHPVWIDGLLSVGDQENQPRLLAHYSIMKSLGERLEHGLALFDEEKGAFEKLRVLDLSQPWQCPREHPVRVKTGGGDFFYFLTPDALVRAPARYEALTTPESYECFSCLGDGSAVDDAVLLRDAGGKLRYRWTKDAPPVGQLGERRLLSSGKIEPEEAHWQVADAATGKPVRMHNGSLTRNDYLGKWLWLAVESGGTSPLGEVWLAVADSPAGPWRKATKIVTHERYSFYNPAHLPFFDEQEGRIIYFMGTYAETFSGNPVATPRYDYNQMVYRLDLADPRLRAE